MYKIKNWDANFENYKSRERNLCSFHVVSNKQTGLGLTRLLCEADGTAIYGMFHLLVGACSQQRAPRGGYLTDTGAPDGYPWIVEDIALRFRRPPAEIQRALDVLSSERIGWIEEVPAEHPQSTHQVPVRARKTPRREEKKKRREEEENSAAKKPAAAVEPSTTTASGKKGTSANPWALWLDVHDDKLRPRPAALGQDTKAAKELGRAVSDIKELAFCFRAYLRDDDQFVAKQGHPLRLLPGRLQAYRLEFQKKKREAEREAREAAEQDAVMADLKKAAEGKPTGEDALAEMDSFFTKLEDQARKDGRA